MDTIRVGFVGLGGICRERHVPGLQRIEGVAMVAVANRTRESAVQAARDFNIPAVCDDWRQLVARDDLDAVFIGTWPYLHHDVSIAALSSGKHVFCQARMAMNFAQALEMCECARAARRVAALCPVPIGLSVDATVDRLMREGYLGEVRLVRVQSFSDNYVSARRPMDWRKDHRLSGLNTLTLGMYVEVIHRWFGWTRSVFATMQTFVPERIDTTGAAVEVQIPDQILFQGEMPGGFPAQYVFSGAVRHGVDAIEIYGSMGTLRYEVAADALRGARAGERMADIEIRREDAYDVANWRVERDFVDAVREGKEYHPSFEDGLRYMQVIQAVFDSAAQERPVRLGDIL